MSKNEQDDSSPKKPSFISFQLKTKLKPQSSVGLSPSPRPAATSSATISGGDKTISIVSSQKIASHSKSPIFDNHEDQEEDGERQAIADSVQSICVIEGPLVPRQEEKKEKKKYVIPMSSEDQEAARLLLEDVDSLSNDEEKVPRRVIPLYLARRRDLNLKESRSEEERFHHDVKHRPDTASLEDYQKMPVEEFGAALLRGMGYNGDEQPTRDNESLNKLLNDPTRRPERLGLGARPRPELEVKKSKK